MSDAAGGLVCPTPAAPGAALHSRNVKQPEADRAPAALKKKLCAFCGADASAFGGHLGRMQGPFYTSSKGHDAVYVHHECALWSPRVRTRSCAAAELAGKHKACIIPPTKPANTDSLHWTQGAGTHGQQQPCFPCGCVCRHRRCI
jgi:hypothetical protein